MSNTEEMPSFIEVHDNPVSVGRCQPANVVLPLPVISPFHATLQREGLSLRIEDHNSQFGTFVNGSRVLEKRAIATRDCIRFGNSIAYIVESNGLRLQTGPDGIGLIAAHLELAKGEKLLVHDAGFTIKPNSFVGILGPSGSGKSTLLQALVGYLRPAGGRLYGEGEREIQDDLPAHLVALGFVAQDDIVFSGLTIRENLDYAARLRFGLKGTADTIQLAVDDALERVELSRVAKNFRYSGGERKRLSVAIELLKRPRLLILDEPTSGLDPASAANLMAQLRKLAWQGTTVVCTTHQLEALDLFDRVIVLGRKMVGASGETAGKIAFVGRPQDLLKAFECSTYAGLFEQLTEGHFEPIASPDERPINKSPDMPLLDFEQAIADAPPSISQFSEQSAKAMRDVALEFVVLASDVSLWNQAQLLVRRSFLMLSRDRWLLLSLVLQPVGLGILTVLSQFRVSAEASVLFFGTVIALWLGMNNSIRDLVRDRKSYVRERLAGVKPDAYFLSRCLVHSVVGIVQVFLLLGVLWLVGGLMFSESTLGDLRIASNFSWLWFVFMASYLGGVGMGFIVSVLVKTEEAALAALPLLIMPQLLLSAVATGQVDAVYDSNRPFRPLVTTLCPLKAPESLSAGLVDLASLVCVSRPATLLAESPRPWVWLGDLCHLTILLATIWAVAYGLFLRQEKDWPRLIGLG
jgi:ABC-type multidrug transport system ATPase subunit